MSNSVTAYLYIGAFACQIAGVALIVWEISDDIRAARRIEEEQAQPSPEGVRTTTPTSETFIGGALGAHLAQTMQATDSFRSFTLERLTGALWRRVLGVVLFVLGAVVELVANLVAL